MNPELSDYGEIIQSELMRTRYIRVGAQGWKPAACKAYKYK